jgi:hypothetical protein
MSTYSDHISLILRDESSSARTFSQSQCQLTRSMQHYLISCPTNAYPKESICLADVAKPSQGKIPADLTLASAFSFCFQ